MALEFSTVGAKVFLDEETVMGTMNASPSWNELPNVIEAPEINLTIDTLEVSSITDGVKRYIPGQQDTGGEKSFTVNHTDAAVAAWAGTWSGTTHSGGLDKNKTYTVEYWIPNATQSFFFSIQPRDLGTGSMSRNEAHTLVCPFVVYKVYGWKTAGTHA